MTHQVAANYTIPAILNTMKPATVRAAATAASATGSTSSSAASGGLDNTFLNLLVKELQNQDPTAPMDSTAMVGQMISLNQLDQLISINQKTAAASTNAGATGRAVPVSGSGGVTAGVVPVAIGGAASVNTLPPSAPASSPLAYFGASTLLPWNPGAQQFGPLTGSANSLLNPAINAAVNAAKMGLSSFDNISGGK